MPCVAEISSVFCNVILAPYTCGLVANYVLAATLMLGCQVGSRKHILKAFYMYLASLS